MGAAGVIRCSFLERQRASFEAGVMYVSALRQQLPDLIVDLRERGRGVLAVASLHDAAVCGP